MTTSFLLNVTNEIRKAKNKIKNVSVPGISDLADGTISQIVPGCVKLLLVQQQQCVHVHMHYRRAAAQFVFPGRGEQVQ